MRYLAGWLLLALPVAAQDAASLRVPAGFKVNSVAKVPGARQLTFAKDGTLYVGSVSNKVYAVLPKNHEVKVVAMGLNAPNGVVCKGDDLFVGEINQVQRFAGLGKGYQAGVTGTVVNSQLPTSRHHGFRYLRFGPDGRLYTGIGAPRNVGEDPLPFASLVRFSPDFKSVSSVARGIRNTMGFDWRPKDGKLWFTDNGRDWLGDDLPPDELNCVPREGLHFGFPYRFGQNQSDPEWGAKAPGALQFTPPRLDFPAHVAALGMKFCRAQGFPQSYQDSIIVCHHGSWNRSRFSGYQVVRVIQLDGRPKSEPLISGWLQGNRYWGRPVDVEAGPDGALYISDDYSGQIYRLAYQRSRSTQDSARKLANRRRIESPWRNHGDDRSSTARPFAPAHHLGGARRQG